MTLEERRLELAEVEAKYRSYEAMMDKSGNLEILSRDLRRQQAGKSSELDLLQEEYENSLKRLETYRIASERVARAERNMSDQQTQLQRRVETEQRLQAAETSATKAVVGVEESASRLQGCEQRLRELRRRTKPRSTRDVKCRSFLTRLENDSDCLSSKNRRRTLGRDCSARNKVRANSKN